MGFVGWGSVVSQLILGTITYPVEQKLIDAFEGDRATQGRITSSVRVIEGRHHPLSGMWWSGVVTLGPGWIVLSRKIALRVLEVDRSEPRKPKVWEQYGVDFEAQIIRVRTEGAVLEWAVRPKFIDWAAGLVGQQLAPE